jgi:hypothetical protein
MSRFQAVREQAVAAPTEADVEQARDFVDALLGDDGHVITEMRLSDGYVSATKMCQSAGRHMSDYMRLNSTIEFMVALAVSLGCPESALTSRRENGPVEGRGTWIHPRLAIHLASWCSPTFAVKVTALVLRYLTGQVTTEESRAAAKTVAERAAPPEETGEDSRALKRLKVTHEIELEKTKHANEMAKHANEMANHANELAKLQSETSRLRMESTRELMEESKRLIDRLASGIAPPALTGMINIARHNLAIKCRTVLGPSGPASDPGIEPPVAPRLVAAARHVTVQEFGKDILSLRGDQTGDGATLGRRQQARQDVEEPAGQGRDRGARLEFRREVVEAHGRGERGSAQVHVFGPARRNDAGKQPHQVLSCIPRHHRDRERTGIRRLDLSAERGRELDARGVPSIVAPVQVNHDPAAG